MPRLIVREMGRERVIEVDLDKVTIGRSKANAVPINDVRASRAHCAIQKTEDGWFVLDLGSSNGTLLNGHPVQRSLLALGDVIAIGDTQIHFERVIDDGAPQKDHTDSAYVAELAETEPAAQEAASAPAAEMPGKKLDSLHADIGGARYLLRMIGGLHPGSTYPLGNQTFTIGRRSTNTLVLEDEKVSGVHAQISREGSVWILTDMNSTNGTIVNGRRISREILEHGTGFSIGNSTLQFVDVHGREVAQPKPADMVDFVEPRGLPSEAEFASIDVQTALKKKGSNAFLTFLYTLAAVFLIVSVVYFSFQVFGRLLGRGSLSAKPGSLITRNWSFEERTRDMSSLPGWVAPPEGWSVDELDAKTGATSLKLDCAVNVEPDDILAVGLAPLTITPDRQYQVKVQVKVDHARRAGVCARWSDPLNPYFVQESFSELVGGEVAKWKALRWAFVPPEKATRMELSLVAFGNSGTVRFDDVELYEKELEPEAVESQAISLGEELEIGFDPRGTWSLYRFGSLVLWDAQVFLSDTEGGITAFSRQSLSGIQKSAAISGNSMLYLGRIFEPYSASWIPLTHEVFAREGTLSVRYEVTGDFKGTGAIGVSLSARADILAGEEIEISDTEGTKFFEDDFEIQGATEMVLGSGENRVSFCFPEEPVDISTKRSKSGIEIVLSRAVPPGKKSSFAIDFSEISLREAQKISSLFSRIEGLRQAGKLGEAVELAQRNLLDMPQGDAKNRMRKLIKEIGEEGDALVKEAQYIYEDFKKSRHPELSKNLGIVVGRIAGAFPGSEREREAGRLLNMAEQDLQKQETRRTEEEASKLLLAGDSYRQRGMLGLAAVYYEYVRDNFGGTEAEKDAKAKLEQVENQIRHEGRW